MEIFDRYLVFSRYYCFLESYQLSRCYAVTEVCEEWNKNLAVLSEAWLDGWAGATSFGMIYTLSQMGE